MLNRLHQLESQPKEYNLLPMPTERLKSKQPGQALVFSEKDLPGYKSKTFAWDDLDEEGNPSQGRSFLYERHKREQKRKEAKGRFQPYSRRPIPKQTAIAGVVAKEFDLVPVKNEEYFVIEARQTAQMLKVPDRPIAIQLGSGDDDPSRRQFQMSATERQNITKVRSDFILLEKPWLIVSRVYKQRDKRKRTTVLRVLEGIFLLANSSNCSNNIEYGVCAI